MTDPQAMEAALENLTPKKIADALNLVRFMQGAGFLDEAEADEWRRRIYARLAFSQLRDDSPPGA
jgi:hypothetical protein